MAARRIIYDTEGIPYQQQAFESRKPKVYLSTGFGGGKTYWLVMKMFQLMNINRRCPGGLLAPSYKMYKRDVVPTIKTVCRENRIPYRYNKSEMTWYFPDAGAVVYAFTAEDDGESIKGPNLAWFCVNEVTLCSENAVMMALARIRLKNAPLLQLAMSGTPEGFNWCYEYFITSPREDTELVFGDSRLNTHVAASYFNTLTESYDELMQEQYVKGQFVNLRGKRFAWAFNRMRHTGDDVVRVPDLPVWVSLDFNVNPMAATLWNRIPLGFYPHDRWGSCLLRAFDEIEIESSNTYEMADAIWECVGRDEQGRPTSPVVLYPDPAGRARSTKSNRSDFDILREKGFDSIKNRLTISIKDCFNALNSLLSKDLMAFNSTKCPETIADMEQCVLKGNVFEIDKSNPRRTHWLDGTKDMVEYEFPIRKPQSRVERTR